MPDTPPIVFSDLDGTLLDHDTYSFSPALPALQRLKKNGIPLILTSSKTPAEILRLRQEMDNPHPFIAENGSVVAVPDNGFPGMNLRELGFSPDKDLWINCLGGSREEILAVLGQLREEGGFPFTGFADMDIDHLCRLTGLSRDGAALAKDRLSTEPILWEGSATQWEAFSAALADRDLAWVQGGRFISVSRPFDKKDGVALLQGLYEETCDNPLVTIGLGDSPNDRAMLDAMDIAVIIKSGRSHGITVNRPRTVIRTTRKGPRGWQEAMDQIFTTGLIHKT